MSPYTLLATTRLQDAVAFKESLVLLLRDLSSRVQHKAYRLVAPIVLLLLSPHRGSTNMDCCRTKQFQYRPSGAWPALGHEDALVMHMRPAKLVELCA